MTPASGPGLHCGKEMPGKIVGFIGEVTPASGPGLHCGIPQIPTGQSSIKYM